MSSLYILCKIILPCICNIPKCEENLKSFKHMAPCMLVRHPPLDFTLTEMSSVQTGVLLETLKAFPSGLHRRPKLRKWGSLPGLSLGWLSGRSSTDAIICPPQGFFSCRSDLVLSCFSCIKARKSLGNTPHDSLCCFCPPLGSGFKNCWMGKSR